jgi:hypothetical protein
MPFADMPLSILLPPKSHDETVLGAMVPPRTSIAADMIVCMRV